MRRSGSIDDDGTLRDVTANLPEGPIRLKGKLGGSGDWRAVGLRCRGSFKVSKR